MEYPTLITAGTRWLIARRDHVQHAGRSGRSTKPATSSSTASSAPTSSRTRGWTKGSTPSRRPAPCCRTAPTASYERRFFGGFVPWVFNDIRLTRETVWNRLPGYRPAPKSDLPSDPVLPLLARRPARTITYNKTALWLNTLERHLGWATLQRILSTYFMRWQFKHPKPDDFFRIANEVSGQDLGWFFDQVYRSSNVFDYGVDDAEERAEDGERFRTDLIVRRDGEALFPVDVRVTFEDGEQITEQWDGRDRWKRYHLRPVRRARGRRRSIPTACCCST